MKPEQVRVLVVEDDDAHAHILIRTLESQHLRLEADRAKDGVEALELLRRIGKGKGRLPHLILLDLKLPRMNGHEFLAEIKSDSTLRRIPVVILTTSERESDRREAYEQQASSYLVKPLEFERFTRMVADLSRYWGRWNRYATN